MTYRIHYLSFSEDCSHTLEPLPMKQCDALIGIFEETLLRVVTTHNEERVFPLVGLRLAKSCKLEGYTLTLTMREDSSKPIWVGTFRKGHKTFTISASVTDH